ncbi:polyprenyl diphosphate synthase [Glycomyces sp. NPDC047369]
MSIRNLVYRAYQWHLAHQMDGRLLPQHIAVAMDGNRRWARQKGFEDPGMGHRYGAQHLSTLLEWAVRHKIHHVTVYLASSDNLRKRDASEIENLMQMIEIMIIERLELPQSPWQLHVAGRLDDVPESTSRAILLACEKTSGRSDYHLNIAIGYDGQEEIIKAIKTVLRNEAARGTDIWDLAGNLSAEDITPHLYTSGRPDPDLIIRTSGERRLSSFLLWQATGAELYFCDVYWPGFRYTDFLRALRAFGDRKRLQKLSEQSDHDNHQ